MLGFNGGLIGKDRTTSLTEAKGVWTLDEQIKARRNDIWPVLTTGYRYIRWTITATKVSDSNLIQVSEFNLINGASNINMSGSTVTISPAGASGSGSQTIASLKDGDTATKWVAETTGGAALPHIITFDMGSITEFNAYRWATANDTPGRDPVSWTVSGSVDNSTFTTLDTETNFAVTDSRQTYVGPFTI